MLVLVSCALIVVHFLVPLASLLLESNRIVLLTSLKNLYDAVEYVDAHNITACVALPNWVKDIYAHGHVLSLNDNGTNVSVTFPFNLSESHIMNGSIMLTQMGDGVVLFRGGDPCRHY